MHFPDLEVCCDWSEFFLGLETIFWDLASEVQNLYSPVSTVTRQITTPPPPDQAFLSGILDTWEDISTFEKPMAVHLNQ